MSPLGNLLTGNECSSVGIGDYYYDVLYVWQGGPNGPASSPLAINGTNDYLGQSVTSSDVDGDARFEAIYTIPMDPSGPSVKIDAMMGPIQPAVLLHGPPGSSAQFGSSLAAR